MMYPYPNISVPADTLIKLDAALDGLLAEVSYSKCTEEACGCTSSRRVGLARRVARELSAIIEAAEAHQALIEEPSND